MASFSTSSHRHHWLFTQEELDEQRRTTNQNARDRIHDMLKQYYANAENRPKKVKYLSLNDERLLCYGYIQKIREVCSSLKLRSNVIASAVLYFKRYFLYQSFMEQNALDTLVTCIYIACKVEEDRVRLDNFLQQISELTQQTFDERSIMDHEIHVLQTMNFDLIVFHPYRSIDGFLYDMQSTLGTYASENMKRIREKAYHITTGSMRSDAALIYPPGTIALAAIRHAAETIADTMINQYIQTKFIGSQSSQTINRGNQEDGSAEDDVVNEEKVEELRQALDRLNHMFEMCEQPLEMKGVKKASKRLNELNSLMEKPREAKKKEIEAEEERKREAKRQAKIHQRKQKDKARELQITGWTDTTNV
eukprot:gb/GECH01003753.1/.p1 GENE.gb/GECH01003753.1/~~gb/GECH01003753.1/.p1  ORF type:complete len:364 (+),score=81.18 gb/GECH01003753.1/:1-1092(+)